jgi:hypothetical protein
LLADLADRVVVEIPKRQNQMDQVRKDLRILPMEVLNLMAQIRQTDKEVQDQLLDQLEVQLNLLQEVHNLRVVQLKEEVRRLSRL